MIFVLADGHELKEGGPSVVDIRSDSQSNLEVFVEQSTPNKAAARNHGPTYFSGGGIQGRLFLQNRLYSVYRSTEHLEEESEFLSTVPGPGQRQMTSVFPQTEGMPESLNTDTLIGLLSNKYKHQSKTQLHYCPSLSRYHALMHFSSPIISIQ